MSLGEFICRRRKHLELTQEQLAEKLHVSKSAVAKWETDGGIPDRDNLYRLAEVLNVPVNDLHHIITSSGPGSDTDVNITAEVIAVLESYGYTVTRRGDEGGEKC